MKNICIKLPCRLFTLATKTCLALFQENSIKTVQFQRHYPCSPSGNHVAKFFHHLFSACEIGYHQLATACLRHCPNGYSAQTTFAKIYADYPPIAASHCRLDLILQFIPAKFGIFYLSLFFSILCIIIVSSFVFMALLLREPKPNETIKKSASAEMLYSSLLEGESDNDEGGDYESENEYESLKRDLIDSESVETGGMSLPVAIDIA